jgi:hypothetical protein
MDIIGTVCKNCGAYHDIDDTGSMREHGRIGDEYRVILVFSCPNCVEDKPDSIGEPV